MSRGLRLAALAALLYVAGVALWVRYDRRAVREVFEPGSVFNSGEQGGSLAYAYLRERTGASQVATLHRRVEPGNLPARATVLRLAPGMGPFLPAEEEEKDKKKDKDNKDGKDGKKKKNGKGGEKEKKKKNGKPGEEEPVRFPLVTPGEAAWMRGGGRLVVAFKGFYGPASARPLHGPHPFRKVFPVWPGVTHLVLPEPRGLAIPGLPGGHAVFLAGDVPLVIRQVVGEGELILLSCPETLENAHLGQGQNLALLEALAGLPEHRPVLFDERSHGLADSSGALHILASWGLGPLILAGILATGAAFWRAAVRLGPPEREGRDTRSDAVELLDSLADLYDRALDRADAVRLYRESFLHTLAVETGLRGKALDERAHTLLDGSDGAPPAAGEQLTRERFAQALRTINQAFRRLQDAKRQ